MNGFKIALTMILSMSKSYCSHFGGHFCSISWSPLFMNLETIPMKFRKPVKITVSWGDVLGSITVKITSNYWIHTHNHISIVAIPKKVNDVSRAILYSLYIMGFIVHGLLPHIITEKWFFLKSNVFIEQWQATSTFVSYIVFASSFL